MVKRSSWYAGLIQHLGALSRDGFDCKSASHQYPVERSAPKHSAELQHRTGRPTEEAVVVPLDRYRADKGQQSAGQCNGAHGRADGPPWRCTSADYHPAGMQPDAAVLFIFRQSPSELMDNRRTQRAEATSPNCKNAP